MLNVAVVLIILINYIIYLCFFFFFFFPLLVFSCMCFKAKVIYMSHIFVQMFLSSLDRIKPGQLTIKAVEKKTMSPNGLQRMMTLKIKARSQESFQLFIKFGQNPSVSSKDSKWKQNFGQNWTFQRAAMTLKIRSRSPKSNQLFQPSKPCIYASLIKIHPLVWKRSLASGR